MKGWHQEPARHGLAARGVKTTFKSRGYPREGRLTTGKTRDQSSIGTRTSTIVDQWSWDEIMSYLKDTHGRYDHVIFTNPDNGKECLILPKKFTKESMTDIDLIKRNLVY